MAFRTTYISCVARLFRYMAQRYFLCLSRTDSCRDELSPSDPIESVCQLLLPLALVNLLLPVPPIKRLCSHFRFRSQSESDVPFTILIYNQFLTHSKIGIHYQHVNFTESRLTETGNPLQGHYYGCTEVRKKPTRKNPFGEKIWHEIWVGTMAQTQSSNRPILRGFSVKQKKFSN